jgi:hypothetical protein
MQRIRQQQKSVRQLRTFGSQDTRLPASVRVATQPNALRPFFADFQNLFAQAFAIAFGITRPGRTMRPFLAK